MERCRYELALEEVGLKGCAFHPKESHTSGRTGNLHIMERRNLMRSHQLFIQADAT